MERKLLERLTGAVLLVLVLVLLAPLTLNGVYDGAPNRDSAAGQADDPGSDTRIFFPNSQGSPRPTNAGSEPEPEALPAEPVLGVDPEPVAEPSPVAVAVALPAAEEPAQTPPAPEAQKPVAAAEPRREPAPEPAVPAGRWQVQLGSFSQRENAENLAGNVRKGGFSATVTGYQRDGRSMYRVRSGPFASRAEADARIRELASIGYRGIVVSPDEG